MGKVSRRSKRNGTSTNNATTTSVTTTTNTKNGTSLTSTSLPPRRRSIYSALHVFGSMVIQFFITLIIIKSSKSLLADFGWINTPPPSPSSSLNDTNNTLDSVSPNESSRNEIESLPTTNSATTTIDNDIPKEFAGPLRNYPNPFERRITPNLKFHPVVKFPQEWSEEDQEGNTTTPKNSTLTTKPKKVKRSLYRVLDFTTTTGKSQLIPPKDQEEFIQARKQQTEETNQKKKNLFAFWNREARESLHYAVGKYDENRKNLYSSNLFQDESNSIDGYDGARTVHMGIDLGGPVGTKVHSFYEGYIHSVGYNDALGDYGHVVVVEHCFPWIDVLEDEGGYAGVCSNAATPSDTKPRQHQFSCSEFCEETTSMSLWALYGHLDSSCLSKKQVGQKVKRGEVLGRIGDVHENGGWSQPHVHFQLSTLRPITHDMPGAVAVNDRDRALFDYPDPRFVLGNLY